MWAGSSASIPKDWVLCDGKNNTPNLLDRFLVGAGKAYAPGVIGGSKSHGHSVTIPLVTRSDNRFGKGPVCGGPGTYPLKAAIHLPPYYSLAYIMKL
jgi:hypothetical protein